MKWGRQGLLAMALALSAAAQAQAPQAGAAAEAALPKPVVKPLLPAVTAPSSASGAAGSGMMASSREPGGIPCLIEPSHMVEIGTPVDGVLEIVNVDRGDLVQPGQLLARLNTGVETASVEYQAAKAEFGARKFGRNEDLQRKQLISSQELDEIATEQRLAELELKERREQLKLRSLHSPIKGVVVDRYRNRGDLVRQEKIFRVAQLDPLHVEVVAPSALFGRIRLEQSYEVSLPLLNLNLPAKVSNVDRVIDAASGTFRVRLVLPNPKYELPSGLRCSISF
jgi:RND family efflux transporter MFP subunit